MSEWQAFAEIEPFGDDDQKAYWRSGLITSAIYNVNRDTKKQRKPYTPEGFMPTFEKQPEPDPAANSRRMLAQVERLNAAFGGTDQRSIH